MDDELKELELDMQKALDDFNLNAAVDFESSDDDDENMQKAIDIDLSVVEADGEFDVYDFMSKGFTVAQSNNGRVANALTGVANLASANTRAVMMQNRLLIDLSNKFSFMMKSIVNGSAGTSKVKAALSTEMAKGMVVDRRFDIVGDHVGITGDDIDVEITDPIGKATKAAIIEEMRKSIGAGENKFNVQEAMAFTKIPDNSSLQDILGRFSPEVKRLVENTISNHSH